MIVPAAFVSMLISPPRERDAERDAGLSDSNAIPRDELLQPDTNAPEDDNFADNDLRSNTGIPMNRSTTLMQRLKSSVYSHLPFQSPSYRVLPIISGIFIPFSVLLAIPGLTGHWYIRTVDNKTVEIHPNPRSLDITLGFSMSSAAIATLALLVRFSERKIKLMTLTCIFFLTIHDIINVVTVTRFGVIHRFDDGFTFGQSFWMTVCSSIVSLVTNVTLVIDYMRIPDFGNNGSGLTRKQRSLLVSIIILLCYIALGALVHSKLLDLSFIDALYFTVASIETIGFGDITPLTTGARIFTCSYAVIGIINLALTINLIRDALVESIQFRLQKRLHEARLMEREQRIHDRWRDAVEWRLKLSHQPIWVDDVDSNTQPSCTLRLAIKRIRRKLATLIRSSARRHSSFLGRRRRDPPRMHLNIESLTMAQLEATALEAGVPLARLLPPDFELPAGNGVKPGISHGPVRTLTHSRLGYMASLIGKVSVAVAMGMSEETILESRQARRDEPPSSKQGGTSEGTNTNRERKALEDMEIVEEEIEEEVGGEERREFYSHLTVAWGIFFVFWMSGSATFMKTEGWSFGTAMYFCFIAFTTLGYGDFSLKTPAGRSIFVVWALLGVGTMTILISIIQEAYTAQYKKVIHTEALQEAVEVYHEGLSEKPSGKKRNIGVPPLDIDSDRGGVHSSILEGTTAVNSSFPPSASVEERLPDRRTLEDLSAQIQKYADHLRQLVALSESANNLSPPNHLREFNAVVLQVPGTESLRRRVNAPDAFSDSVSRQLFINLAMERIINEISSLAQETVAQEFGSTSKL